MALPSPRGLQRTDHIAGLALCAGVGGLELGLTIAEPRYRTVGYVERDAFAASALVARMGDEALDRAPIWSDLATFDGRPWRGKVDIVTAGYPCQPFTFSGRRKGEGDPRHLWPHVRRIAEEIRPSALFCENVEGHLSLGFPVVAGDIRAMGYELRAGLFSAAETGAGHIRRRLFILAYTPGDGLWQPGRNRNRRGGGPVPAGQEPRQPDRLGQHGADLDADMAPGEGGGLPGGTGGGDLPFLPPGPGEFAGWEQVLARRADLQPCLFGLADGLAHRMERSRAGGNGVHPLAAAVAWCTLTTGLNHF